jgi:hypothetical protein
MFVQLRVDKVSMTGQDMMKDLSTCARAIVVLGNIEQAHSVIIGLYSNPVQLLLFIYPDQKIQFGKFFSTIVCRHGSRPRQDQNQPKKVETRTDFCFVQTKIETNSENQDQDKPRPRLQKSAIISWASCSQLSFRVLLVVTCYSVDFV